jgi:CheY-like chemotaxis protein
MFSEVDIENWVVIIADDEPDNVLVAKTLLSYYGARVYVAANGAEVLALLSVIRPTFVLLDLAMPVLNGWRTLDEIRQRSRFPALPVIACSAQAVPAQREAALAAGFDEFIGKPFKFKSFLEEIHACLEHIEQRIEQVSLVG